MESPSFEGDFHFCYCSARFVATRVIRAQTSCYFHALLNFNR